MLADNHASDPDTLLYPLAADANRSGLFRSSLLLSPWSTFVTLSLRCASLLRTPSGRLGSYGASTSTSSMTTLCDRLSATFPARRGGQVGLTWWYQPI